MGGWVGGFGGLVGGWAGWWVGGWVHRLAGHAVSDGAMSDALGALCCPGVSLAVTPAAVSPWRTIPTCLQRLLTRMSSWCSWMTPQTCPPCCGTISSTAGWSPTGGCWGQVSARRRGRMGSREAPGACRGGVQDWSQRDWAAVGTGSCGAQQALPPLSWPAYPRRRAQEAPGQHPAGLHRLLPFRVWGTAGHQEHRQHGAGGAVRLAAQCLLRRRLLCRC